MKLDLVFIGAVIGKPMTAAAKANAKQVLTSLIKYGDQFELDRPHRAAHFLAQVLHESGRFQYDKEIWGPTPAQERYDTRTDLGNTKVVDGDGFLFRGRTGTQVTGKANYTAFRDWCRQYISAGAPDFVADPDAILLDPWKGLAPIWYWSTRNLNKLADANNLEGITKRINGGRNGLEDRMALYTRIALVMLGFGPTSIKAFQEWAKLEGLYTGNIDNDDGPLTRAALHKALARLSGSTVTAAPVTETVKEAVTPAALDKPVTKTFGFWERLAQIGGALGTAGLGAWFQDWKVVVALCGGLVVLAVVGLLLHKRIIDAVKDIKASINS